MGVEITIPGSGNDPYPLPFNAVSKIAQSFLTSSGFDLDTVYLQFSRVGTPGTITCTLYAADGSGFPTGGALASDTYNGDSVAGYPTYTGVYFDMGDYTLSGATSYCVELQVSDGVHATDLVYVKATLGNPYADGTATYYDGSWGTLTNRDIGSVLRSPDAAPSKASNPTPADAATEVDFSGGVLDWDGDGDTYDVRGGASGNFVLFASGISASTYTLDAAEKLLCKNGVVTWRVDSTNAVGTTTGDDWTFDPRPGKSSSPTPSDTGTDIATSTDFSWTIGTNGTTNELFISSTSYLDSSDVTYSMTSDLFDYEASVSWNVDTTNEYGTTTGDTWTFTAQTFDLLRISYTLISGGSGYGPYDATPGVEGTDFWYTGLNNVITLKRLVVAANDKIHYESFT